MYDADKYSARSWACAGCAEYCKVFISDKATNVGTIFLAAFTSAPPSHSPSRCVLRRRRELEPRSFPPRRPSGCPSLALRPPSPPALCFRLKRREGRRLRRGERRRLRRRHGRRLQRRERSRLQGRQRARTLRYLYPPTAWTHLPASASCSRGSYWSDR